MGPNAPFVHDLLRHFGAVGFDRAPRLPGVDEREREVLSFVEGEVPNDHGEHRPSEARRIKVAGLIRRFHDAKACYDLGISGEVGARNPRVA
jgi:hypothetical protein